jgi:peptidylprolyl isomerase
VAVSAANALTGVRQLAPEEAEALMEWVADHPRDWRRAGPILAVLGRMGAREFLVRWLDQWEEDAVIPRTRGIGALAFVPGPEATEYLMEAARSPQPRIRATALGGLARRWRVERQNPDVLTDYFQVFTEGLRTGDPSSVYVAAPALADSAFQALGSVTVLMNEYGNQTLPEDLEGMQALLRAIGLSGTPEAEAFLRRELRNATSPALQQAAAGGLSALTGQEVEVPGGVMQEARQIDWAALAELGSRPRMVLTTAKGTVTLLLDAESAPLTVQTIAGFAQEGLYDDTPFHRVVPNFVVQGGDFARQDGFGGPGFSIRSEFTQIPYRRGVLGMASSGKDTEGSQFFITHSLARHLDGGYTAFGWVESGMDVVDALLEEDRILTARIEPDRS